MPSLAHISAMPCSRRCSAPRHGASRSRPRRRARRRCCRRRGRTAGPIPRSTRGSRRRRSRGRRPPGRAGHWPRRRRCRSRRVGVAVARIDDAAREHPRAAGVVGAVGAAREQHLDAAGAVADDDDGRGGPRRPLRGRLGGGCREGRSVGGRSTHRRSAGANRGSVECGTDRMRRWRPSATSDIAAIALPTALAPCCLSPRTAAAAKMTPSQRPTLQRRRLRKTRSSTPCFTMPSFSS